MVGAALQGTSPSSASFSRSASIQRVRSLQRIHSSMQHMSSLQQSVSLQHAVSVQHTNSLQHLGSLRAAALQHSHSFQQLPRAPSTGPSPKEVVGPLSTEVNSARGRAATDMEGLQQVHSQRMMQRTTSAYVPCLWVVWVGGPRVGATISNAGALSTLFGCLFGRSNTSSVFL
jgi:hypothetical protein